MSIQMTTQRCHTQKVLLVKWIKIINYIWLPVEEMVILQVKKLINAQTKQRNKEKKSIY